VPHRTLVTRGLATFLGALSHPQRIRIVEELRAGECDVNTLAGALGISHSGVSQHLMVLRAHRIVAERKQGRQVFYRLRQPGLAAWLLDATEYLGQPDEERQLHEAIRKTRKVWAVK
jgi:DNA-binding transcriptional ArsR family regulator